MVITSRTKRMVDFIGRIYLGRQIKCLGRLIASSMRLRLGKYRTHNRLLTKIKIL